MRRRCLRKNRNVRSVRPSPTTDSSHRRHPRPRTCSPNRRRRQNAIDRPRSPVFTRCRGTAAARAAFPAGVRATDSDSSASGDRRITSDADFRKCAFRGSSSIGAKLDSRTPTTSSTKLAQDSGRTTSTTLRHPFDLAVRPSHWLPPTILRPFCCPSGGYLCPEISRRPEPCTPVNGLGYCFNDRTSVVGPKMTLR